MFEKVMSTLLGLIRLLLFRRYISSFGAKIYVPNNIPLRFKLNIYLSRYERAEITSCLKIDKVKVNRILEIGGGVGILSKILNENFHPLEHKIFEPIATNLQAIKKQKISNNVEIHNSAVVLDEDLDMVFFQKESVFGSGFIPNQKERKLGKEKDQIVKTSVSNIDISRYDLIIVDVEGYEEKLLPYISAKAKNSIIIFEYHQTKVTCSLNKFLKNIKGDVYHYEGNVFMIISEKSSNV